MLDNLPLEIRLILSCATTRITPDASETIDRFAAQDLNWELVAELAVKHNVVPIVYSSLDTVCPERVPESILKDLKVVFLDNVARSLLYSTRLVTLIKALNGAGIRAIPIKGPVLAEIAYKNLALRQFVDLDILIPKEDAIKAIACLTALGLEPEIVLKEKDLRSYVTCEDNMTFLNPGSGVPVELHWEMSGGYANQPIGFSAFSKRLQTVLLLDHSVKSLEPESYLVYLCLHGSRHGWCYLDMICCVSELIKASPQIQWNRVADTAKEWHVSRALLLGLFLSHLCLGTAIPAGILKRIRQDKAVIRLARMVMEALFANGTPVSLFPFLMRLRDTYLDRLHFLIRYLTLPTKEDWRTTNLPSAVWFMRYGTRPVRLGMAWLQRGGID